MSSSRVGRITRQHEETHLPELRGAECGVFQVVYSKVQAGIGPMYLQLDGTWHRFYLDAGLLFWEEGRQPDEEDDLLDEEEYIDWGKELGVIGVRVSEIFIAESTLTLRFENGAEAVLRQAPRDEITSVVRVTPGG